MGEPFIYHTTIRGRHGLRPFTVRIHDLPIEDTGPEADRLERALKLAMDLGQPAQQPAGKA